MLFSGLVLAPEGYGRGDKLPQNAACIKSATRKMWPGVRISLTRFRSFLREFGPKMAGFSRHAVTRFMGSSAPLRPIAACIDSRRMRHRRAQWRSRGAVPVVTQADKAGAKSDNIASGKSERRSQNSFYFGNIHTIGK